MTFRNQLMIAIAALTLSACDYAKKTDYNVTAEYKAFVKSLDSTDKSN